MGLWREYLRIHQGVDHPALECEICLQIRALINIDSQAEDGKREEANDLGLRSGSRKGIKVDEF